MGILIVSSYSTVPPKQTSSPSKSFAPPSRTTSRPQHINRHINNSLSGYLFRNSKLQLGKSKEFNNQGMNIQVKRAFKSYSLFVIKKTIKNLFAISPFLLPPQSPNPQVRINKMVNEHSINYHHEDTSKIHTFIFLQSAQGFFSLHIQ